MKILVFSLLVMLSFPATAKINEAYCKSVNAKIENINKKMKKGYSNSLGEYYKKELKKLEKERYKCWKKGFKK